MAVPNGAAIFIAAKMLEEAHPDQIVVGTEQRSVKKHSPRIYSWVVND